MYNPPISLVLATMNALPHLKDAIAGLQNQTYDNFSLLVQDGGSTDGTLEFLRSSSSSFLIDIDSRPDSGIAQAYSRGLARVEGDYAMIVSADEVLHPHALSHLMRLHQAQPTLAIAYGAMTLVDEKGEAMQNFFPKPFDFGRVISCLDVPPIATCMFNIGVLGDDFRYDETLVTCPDYEFWLRVGGRFEESRFVCSEDILATARGDRTSMSYRTEAYVQMARDKFVALERYIAATVSSPSLARELVRRYGQQIYCWAAEMTMSIDSECPAAFELVREALAFGPPDPRLQAITTSSPHMSTWAMDPSRPPPVRPSQQEGFLALYELDIHSGHMSPSWGAKARDGAPLEIVGGPGDWGYSWQLPLTAPELTPGDREPWLQVEFEVLTGRVGWSLLENDRMIGEKPFVPSRSKASWSIPLSELSSGCKLLLRNSGQPNSIARIDRVTVLARR
ncbi:MAG: glycosyltransferase [Hyphomicrobiales bacterium]|nr:glycosyltransferase [Hyphomicrobiales bacterium]MBV9521062.1 glycosyltransferase [Hyphomicrobiales bacterium]